MKTSEALRATRKYLLTPDEIRSVRYLPGKKRFVCFAADKLQYPADTGKVRAVIEKVIGRFGTLDDWLEVNHGILGYDDAYQAKMQYTRHCWVEHLAAQYESWGD